MTLNKQLRILALLKQNLNNPHPQIMELVSIADALQLSHSETRSLLLKMNDLGVIMSDPEGSHCLITRQGLQLINSMVDTLTYSTEKSLQ